MPNYFNIHYEFDKQEVLRLIDRQVRDNRPGYICVADGVILSIAHDKPDYLKVVNESMFSICDSSFVPLYIKWIHGKSYPQYCGSQIFRDIVSLRRYRMFFMGTSHQILAGLKQNIKAWNPDVEDMTFYDLPYRDVEDFDYPQIAHLIHEDNADIIWVALGAPKQEIFMNRLKPHLKRGVMIAVGAAFKFYSGQEEKRAPKWMIKHHMEFLFRIINDPKKQFRRCAGILRTLPQICYEEWKRKRKGQ